MPPKEDLAYFFFARKYKYNLTLTNNCWIFIFCCSIIFGSYNLINYHHADFIYPHQYFLAFFVFVYLNNNTN